MVGGDDYAKHFSGDMTQRTGQQRKSIEVYSRLMAGSLNDGGYTQRKVLDLFKDGFEFDNTQSSFKDIYREVGRIMYGIKSTSELSTIQAQKVYTVIDQRFSELTGIRHEWPSNEPPLLTEHEIRQNAT